jgi:cobalamin biosynthesis Mg chelatase CobN
VARTYSSETESDSTDVHKRLDSYTNEDIRQSLDWNCSLEQVTVTEKYSAPDSAGHQFLTERTTTTTKGRTESSAQASHTKDQKIQEQTDSTSTNRKESAMIKEEEKTISADTGGWMPWYVYVIALFVLTVLAALLGSGLLKRPRNIKIV